MGITNSQYDAIMRVYEKRRIDNHHVEEARRRTAYEAIPALAQLDRAVASLSVETVRQSLFHRESSLAISPSLGQAPQHEGAARIQTSGDLTSRDLRPSDIGELLREAAGGMSVHDRRRLLLKEHSFPEDYLDPVYTCKDCRDTGWIGARHCHCFDREVVSYFYTQSGLSVSLEKENFDTFDLSWYPEDLIDAKSGKSSRQIMTYALLTCRNFALEYGSDRQKKHLLLTGAAGLGKTFLTHCIAKVLIDKGRSVIYYSAGELFDMLAERFFRRAQDEDGMEFDDSYLSGCDLLIIDDLGTELTNSFVGSALFQLLNTRIARGCGTVISTNLSPLELGQVYSDRISSRIMEHFLLVRVFGEDIRVRKRLGRR